MSNKSPVPEWFDRGGAKESPGAGPGGAKSGCSSMIAALLFAIAVGCFVFAVKSELRIKQLENQLASLQRKSDEAELERNRTERERLAAAPAAEPEPPVVPVPAATPVPTPTPEVPSAAEAETGDAGGERDAQGILAVMNKLRPSMKRCYEVALADDPKASGRLQLAISIAASGSVEQVTVTPSGNLPPSVGACVSRVVRTAHFPAASQKTSVNYPVVFAAM